MFSLWAKQSKAIPYLYMILAYYFSIPRSKLEADAIGASKMILQGRPSHARDLESIDWKKPRLHPPRIKADIIEGQEKVERALPQNQTPSEARALQGCTERKSMARVPNDQTLCRIEPEDYLRWMPLIAALDLILGPSDRLAQNFC